MAVKDGGVASVMCSYNSVNGASMCENKHILTDVLRGQWGFTGYVQSDFFAAHSTANTMLAGLDNEMPGIDVAAAHDLVDAAEDQRGADSGANQAVGHRYRARPPLYADVQAGHLRPAGAQTAIDATGDGAIARAIGEQSAVLLKNSNNVLPFRRQDRAFRRADRAVGVCEQSGRWLLRRQLRRDPALHGHAARRRAECAETTRIERDREPHHRRRRQQQSRRRRRRRKAGRRRDRAGRNDCRGGRGPAEHRAVEQSGCRSSPPSPRRIRARRS